MTTNKRMVELDAVLKVLSNWRVLDICDGRVQEEIEALPSIPNPIEIAEDIEKKAENNQNLCQKDLAGFGRHQYFGGKIDACQELLSKLKA